MKSTATRSFVQSQPLCWACYLSNQIPPSLCVHANSRDSISISDGLIYHPHSVQTVSSTRRLRCVDSCVSIGFGRGQCETLAFVYCQGLRALTRMLTNGDCFSTAGVS